jgi:hypothetical protein
MAYAPEISFQAIHHGMGRAGRCQINSLHCLRAYIVGPEKHLIC